MMFIAPIEPGEKIWVVSPEGPKELTVGRIQITYTDSKGSGDPEEIFDNYKPQNSYEISYMCDETGIGSGAVYTLGKHAFLYKKDCENRMEELKE